MFNSNTGFNNFTPQPNNNQNGIFGNKPANTGGVFGSNNNQPQQNNGGLFGTQNNGMNNGNTFAGNNQQTTPFGQPSQGQGVFGNNTPNNNIGGVFGNNSQQPNQVQGQGLFGNNQNNQGAGIFNNQPQANTGGVFGNQTGNNNAFGGVGVGNGIFGGQSQQQTQGIFGNGNAQTNNGNGIFGGNQAQQNNGIFNNNNQAQTGSNVFGVNTQGNGAGLFGAASNNANNAFLGNNNNTTPFGNNAPTNNIFGGANNNTGNNAFGVNSNNNGGNNIFGGGISNNNTTSNNVFGGNNGINNNNAFGNNATQQPNNTGGLFNTFASTTTQPQNSFLGGQQTNNNLGASTFFGNNNNNNNTNTNKLGGTSWGVPTLNNTPSLGNTLGGNLNTGMGGLGSVGGAQTLQPIKSKNSKLDAKHLIKCISALDQFGGVTTKEEIRISFIQSGGQQPVINQQQTLQPATSFGNSTSAFKPFTAPTSLPSFNNIAPNNNSMFGQTQPAAQNVFGQNNGAQNNSIFGQTANTPAFGQTNNSIFGQTANTPAFGQTQNNSIFGQQPQNTTVFGQTQNTSIFGQAQQNTNQSPNSLITFTPSFGSNNQGNSLFGNQPTAQQGNSLFNQGTTSLFNQPAANNSMFGQAGTTQVPSLFGQTQVPFMSGQPQNQTPSLFGAPQTSLFPQQQTLQTPNLYGAQTPSLFPNVQSVAQPGFFNQSASVGGFFNSTSIQPQAVNSQQLLPQLILALALSQPQNRELATKLTQLLKTSSSQKQNKTQLQPYKPIPDAYEQLMKQTRLEYYAKNPKVQSLFSDYQREVGIQQFLQTPLYIEEKPIKPIRMEDIKIYKPQQTFLPGSKGYNQPVIGKRYLQSKERMKKKIAQQEAKLPRIGRFSIYPPLEAIKRMTHEELKQVQNVRVWNKFGEIEFLESISLLGLDVSQKLVISQDNIQICDKELETKKVRMTFKNFGHYTSLRDEQRQNIIRKMRKWIVKYQMRQVSHDKKTGDLIVEVDN